MRPTTRNAVGGFVAIIAAVLPILLVAGLRPPWPVSADDTFYPICLIGGPLVALIGIVVATLPLDQGRTGIASLALGRALVLEILCYSLIFT